MPVRRPMADVKGYLSPEEVNDVIQVANNLRDKLLITLLWQTGMRVSELLALKVSDILWNDRAIVATRLKKRTGEEKRRLPVSSRTLNVLNSYLRNRKRGYVFDLTRQRVYQIVRQAMEKAGIKNVGERRKYIWRLKKTQRTRPHPHILRHSFAINWIKKGGSAEKLQKWLGHADLMTTSQYLQFSDADLREDWEKVFPEEQS